MATQNKADSESQELVITRVFEAPRDLVWKAFTEEERLMHWWGPKGFKMRSAKVNLRPGGRFHYAMEGPDGSVMWGRFVYKELKAPEKMVIVSSFSDETGGVTRHPMAPTWPLEMQTTSTFSEQDGKTTLTLRVVAVNASEEEQRTFNEGFRSMQGGFGGTFDQLEEYLATVR